MTKLILISIVLVVFLAVAGKTIETTVKESIEYSINLFYIFIVHSSERKIVNLHG